MADTDMFLVASAIVGALVTLDPADTREKARDVIPWAVGMLAIAALATAESVRGFFYLLAMPIGLFVAANVAATMLLVLWRVFRDRGA
ncbi:hypothetical protein [Sphingobium indicum]